MEVVGLAPGQFHRADYSKEALHTASCAGNVQAEHLIYHQPRHYVKHLPNFLFAQFVSHVNRPAVGTA